MTDIHRTTRRTQERPESPDDEVHSVYDWILTEYYGTLTSEVSHALDQLHNATNWGLTLITAGLVAVISRSQFPDTASLFILLALLVVCIHFSVRVMKGYINVIRFGLIQRRITASALYDTEPSASLSDIRTAIKDYHVDWLLPLKRRDVYIKCILELGYGYMIIIIAAVLMYTCISIRMDQTDWIALVIAIMLAAAETGLFARSPYMHRPRPDEDARRQR